jgi:hypothetical protein
MTKQLALTVITVMFLLVGCANATATSAPTRMPDTVIPQPTATSLPTNTPAPTETATPVPIEALLPKDIPVDHVEKLSDGRTVAIAPLTDLQKQAGETPMFRVLEWNGKEWVKYKSEILISDIVKNEYIRRYGKEFSDWLNNLEIPEVIHPLLDKNGIQYPLGYDGKVPMPEGNTEYVLSGVIVGVKENIPNSYADIFIAIPTKQGDYVLADFSWATNDIQQNMLGLFIADRLDVSQMYTQGGSWKDFMLNALYTNVDPKYNISNEKILGDYALSHNLVGTQFGLSITIGGWDNPDTNKSQEDFYKVIWGQAPLAPNAFLHPRSQIYLFPDSMLDLFTNNPENH